MKIGQFELVNEEKLNRVLKGTIGQKGQLINGLEALSDWASKTEEEQGALIIAAYDKIGGLILKDGLKVATGSFYDVVAKAPRKEPKLSFITSVDDELVEVTEDEAKVIESSKSKIESLKKKKKRARV